MELYACSVVYDDCWRNCVCVEYFTVNVVGIMCVFRSI